MNARSELAQQLRTVQAAEQQLQAELHNLQQQMSEKEAHLAAVVAVSFRGFQAFSQVV